MDSKSNLATTPERSLSETLEQLVEDHFDFLFAYAFRFFRSEERSHDVVQETFLAATENFSKFERRSTARTWLTSILRHKIIDVIRKKNLEQSYDFSSEDTELESLLFYNRGHWRDENGPQNWSCPHSVLERKQLSGILDQCLGKLPSHVREIFLLRELDNCGRDEICSQFSLSSSNVGIMLFRARLSLQHCLQKHWFTKTKKSEENS